MSLFLSIHYFVLGPLDHLKTPYLMKRARVDLVGKNVTGWLHNVHMKLLNLCCVIKVTICFSVGHFLFGVC